MLQQESRQLTRRDEFLAQAARIADIGLVVGGGLALLLFGYYFYHYSLTGERRFDSPLSMTLSYGVPLGVAVLLFVSLRFTPAQRINLFVLCATSIASVYGLELFMEWRVSSLYAATKPVMTLLTDATDKPREAAALTRQWGVEIDTRRADEVIASLRKSGVDAVPIMTPSNQLFIKEPDGSIKSAVHMDGQEVMPLAGVSNKVTLLCNENGQWIDYRSDRHGFNNPDKIWDSDRLEIAVLGDSFAHGYCVPAAKSFVALIRQRYPATLNLGIAGDGPLLMLATLKEYVPLFKPKVVLWFYFEGNDLTDLQSERKSALLRNYLDDRFTQSALVRQNDLDRAMLLQMPRLVALDQTNRERREDGRFVGDLVSLAKLQALRLRLGLVGGMEADDAGTAADLDGPTMNAFRHVLLKVKGRIDGWGGQLVFVYLPDWARYTNDTSPGESRRGAVLSLVRNLEIPIVDMVPVFQANGDPLSLFPFRRPGHYNDMGHRLVAEEVTKALSQGHHLQ